MQRMMFYGIVVVGGKGKVGRGAREVKTLKGCGARRLTLKKRNKEGGSSLAGVGSFIVQAMDTLQTALSWQCRWAWMRADTSDLQPYCISER